MDLLQIRYFQLRGWTVKVSKDRYMKSSMPQCIRIRNYTHLKYAIGLNIDKFGRSGLRVLDNH